MRSGSPNSLSAIWRIVQLDCDGWDYRWGANEDKGLEARRVTINSMLISVCPILLIKETEMG